MKKITSIFSLGLLLSTGLLLGSCGDCESGPACDGGSASSATVEELKQKVAEQANQLAALSSEVDNVPYTITQDADGNIWLENLKTGQKQPVATGLQGPKGDTGAQGPQGPQGTAGTTPTVLINGDGYWVINGTTTTVKAKGEDGTTPTVTINDDGYWVINGTATTVKAKGEDGAQGPQGPKGDTGNSGILDAAKDGVYVKYGDGENDTIYIPKVSEDANYVYIKVGGTDYKLPKNGGGSCTCDWSLTWDDAKKRWTVSDGTSSVEIPVWIKDAEVSYDATTQQFTLKSGDASTVIPKGYADVVVDPTTGVATIKGADGSTKIQLQPTQSVVAAAANDTVVVINYDIATGLPKDTLKLPSFAHFTALTTKVGEISNKLDDLASQVGTWDPAAHNGQTMAQALDSLSNELNSLEKKLSKMFENVYDAIAKSITNIQIEEVMSNAIGSYNGVISNLKTTKLVGYYGTTDEIIFPKHDPIFYKPAGDPAMIETLGEINLTVNPLDKDFSGVAVSLVNSLGQESSIKLSNLESSDKLLMTGLTGNTRADGGTGLYKTTATIDGNSVEDPRLHMAVDKSAVKEAVKAAWHDLKEVYNQRRLGAVQGETVNKIANAIYSTVSGISTERLAIKTTAKYETTDSLTGNKITSEKTVVSPYDLSGVMVKPLGFESLPEQYRDSIRVFKKAKKAIKKLNTRIAKKIIRTINKEADLNNIDKQIKELKIKIKKVKPIPDSMKIIKQVVDIDTTITVKVPVDYTTNVRIDTVLALNVPVEVEFDAVVPKNFSFDESTHKVTVTEWGDLDKTVNVVTNINFVYSRDVRFQKELETDVRFWIQKEFSFDMSDMVDNVNNALDVVTSVDGLCNSVQKIINNIYKYENKLLAGTYLNRIYKLIDKASAYSAQGIYKLFQPVLLVNSDKGFGFAGIRGVPATVTGTVEVIPTTYSNGLVAPVYKKYISVNGANGKVLDEGQVTLDITSDLQEGYNTVEYYAIDFYGNEIGEEYVVIKE